MEYIKHPELLPMPHGFFTRNGGVSGGIYSSANMSYASGDIPQNVTANITRVKFLLQLNSLVTLHQIHSNIVHSITPKNVCAFKTVPIQGDGLVCAMPNVGIGVLSADCVPVLFADMYNNIVGACHAGWGGAVQGVMQKTVDTMIHMGANRDTITAVLGPSIAQNSYEVDVHFKQKFCANTAENIKYFIRWQDLNSPLPSSHKQSYAFDLPGFVMGALRQYGITPHMLQDTDTYTHGDRFFSYRRATHKKQPDYGRQISAIGCVK